MGVADGNQEGPARVVIGVAGPVGAGKTTLCRALGQALGAPVFHFDQFETFTQQPLEAVRAWAARGGDFDEFEVAVLPELLADFKAGRPLPSRFTQAATARADALVLETQFGRRPRATGRHIDVLVWLDTPPDVALARKLKEFAGIAHTRGAPAFVDWLSTYLNHYLDTIASLLRAQREQVMPQADLVVDGAQPLEVVLAAVLERLRSLRV